MPKLAFILVLLIALLAACDTFEDPEAFPTHEFSAPPLQPSPTIAFHMPTEITEDHTNPGQNIPLAAGIPAHANVPPVPLDSGGEPGRQIVQIMTDQGTTIIGDLYENPSMPLEGDILPQRYPGLLLAGAPRNAWGDFPARLRDSGYTVLVVDFEADSAAGDFAAVMRALSNAALVNPGVMGAVGTGTGADLALLGCSVEALCKATVLISPQNRDSLLGALTGYNPRPLLLVATTQDTTAQAIHQSAAASTLQTYDTAAQSVDLLATQPDLGQTIIQWLAQHLAE
jgi:hypothetical protein